MRVWQLHSILLFTLLVAVPGVHAQSSEDFRVESWRGGILEGSLGLAMHRGAPGAISVGGVIQARRAVDPGVLFSSPALLSALTPGLLFEGRLGVHNGSIAGFGDALVSQDDVRAATDDFLADYAFAGEPDYTRLQGVTAGQPGQIAAIAAAHRLAPGVMVAAGFQRPLSASFDYRASGTEFVLDAGRRSGAQTIDIDVLGQVSGASAMRATVDMLSAGLGVELGSDDLGSWHFGVATSRSTVSAGIDWSFQPELMIVLSGSQQYFFNDPSDPNLAPGETNALFWRARADYRGSGWGARAGLRFSGAREILTVMIDGHWTEDVRMVDPFATATSFLPLFVNLSGSSDPGPFEDEILDVEALNLAKPNLTKASTDSLGTALTMRRPDALTLTMDLGLGPHTITANYVRYAGELSLEGTYGSRRGEPKTFRVGKKLDYEVRAALDLRFPDRMQGAGWLLLPVRLLFLDLDGLLFQALAPVTGYRNPHYRIGGGVVFGAAVVNGVERNVRSDVRSLLDGALPSGLAMARSYTLFDRLDVGVTVVGAPDLLFRTSLGWRFGPRPD